MANWFDQVTKTLADDNLSRRQAIRRVAGIVAGAAFASVIPEIGAASSSLLGRAAFKTCGGGGACSNPGTCSTGFQNCSGNINCFCFQKIGSTKGACGCNSYCASIAPCSSQSQCAKGHTCITNTGCGCTSGFCIPNCSKTCHFPASRAGRTAAPVREQPLAFTLALNPLAGTDDTTITATGNGLMPAGDSSDTIVIKANGITVADFELEDGDTGFVTTFSLGSQFSDLQPGTMIPVQADHLLCGKSVEMSNVVNFTLNE